MALVLTCTCTTLKAQNTLFTQSVKGTVTDAESKRPLPEATVTISGISKGTVTDSLGNFTIPDIPVGRQTLLITRMGYEQKIVPEVLVSSGKEIFLNVALTERIKLLDEVDRKSVL